MQFEIIVRQLENGEILGEYLIKEIEVKKPKNIMDVGFRHSEQISIIDEIQDQYIPLQCKLLLSESSCPRCGSKLMKNRVVAK